MYNPPPTPPCHGASQVQPLNALLLSYRQLKAGPAVLRRPAPRLKEHYLAQIRPSGSGGGAADQGLTSGPWIVREEEPRGRCGRCEPGGAGDAIQYSRNQCCSWQAGAKNGVGNQMAAVLVGLELHS